MQKEEKQQMIEMYLNGKTAKELSKIFPYHNSTISKMLKKKAFLVG